MWGATIIARPHTKNKGISIHAPRVGSDAIIGSCDTEEKDFNPRSPCGERHVARLNTSYKKLFQSTLPVWGATLCRLVGFLRIRISIHAPRVGSDHAIRNLYRREPISIHAPRVGSDKATYKKYD